MVHGLFYPSVSSLAAARFHPINTGQALGLYLSSYALGMFVGPPVWGFIADRTGYPAMFLAAGLVMVFATAWFLLSLHTAGRRTSSTSAEIGLR